MTSFMFNDPQLDAKRAKAIEDEEALAREQLREDALRRAPRSWKFPLLVIFLAVLATLVRRFFPSFTLVPAAVGVVNLILIVYGSMALLRACWHAGRVGWRGLTGHIIVGTILNIPVFIWYALLVAQYFKKGVW
jgi:hypothetical protein